MERFYYYNCDQNHRSCNITWNDPNRIEAIVGAQDGKVRA